MNEDAYLDTWMEARLSGGDQWDDDSYWVNQREADDYRDEMCDFEDWED